MIAFVRKPGRPDGDNEPAGVNAANGLQTNPLRASL
jgi:hypothetical protein